MKVRIFFLVAFVMLHSSIVAQQVITLEYAIETGIRNSKILQATDSRIKISKARYDEIVSQRLPVLQLGAGFQHVSEVPPFTVNLPFSPVPVTIQESIQNQYQLKLSLIQPVFTGFRLISQQRAAEHLLRANLVSDQKELNEEVFRIVSAYLQLYLAREQYSVTNEMMKSASAHAEDAQALYKNGLITKNDLLKIKVQHSSAGIANIEAQNTFQNAAMQFLKTIGLPLDTRFSLPAEYTPVTAIIPDSAEALNNALSERCELQELHQRTQAAENMKTAAQSGWYPQIQLHSSFYYNRPNQRIMPAKDQFDETWDVGVSLQWNLWDWGGTAARAEQATEEIRGLQIASNQTKDAISLEVNYNLLNLRTAQERVKLAELLVEQSSEEYTITNAAFKFQAATSTELLDSENAYFRNRSLLLQVKVQQELIKLALLKSIGKPLRQILQ